MNCSSRRHILGSAALLTGAAVTASSVSGEEKKTPAEKKKLKIVVTGGHPGDPEYGCGGTIARYTDLGHDVVNLYLNRGEWKKNPETDPDPAPIRMAEARSACEILGATASFGDQIDGESIIDKAHYESFRKFVEVEKPDIVFTHWPLDQHPDHRALSMLIFDAWFRLGKRFDLFYYEVTNGHDTLQFAPTDYVDISSVLDRKKRACYAHASQRPDDFFTIQETVTKMRGIENGCEQAEAFIRQVQSPGYGLPGVVTRT